MFIVLFLVGLIGFVAMTALGFLHVGHHTAAGHHSIFGHAFGGAHHVHAAGVSHGHAGATHSSGSAAHASHGQTGAASRPGGVKAADAKSADKTGLWFAISPLDIFSLCLGAGAAGILLQTLIPAADLLYVALAGALIFNFGIVRPLINTLANFASRPSDGLEGMVAKGAVAATKFDSEGRGLIKVTLDGQNIQVLALLEVDEVQRGVVVAKGDPVTIVEVDKTRNRCRVTRELAA